MIFERIGNERGLSQSLVYCISQDANGFMWFGTQEGLNRFDGYSFKRYFHNPHNHQSLSGNQINKLFTDSEGDLWVGSFSNSISKYNYSEDSFIHYLFQTDREESISIIRAITEEPPDHLWIGTHGNGLIRFNKRNGTAEHFINSPDKDSIASNYISHLHLEEENLFIGTWGKGFSIFNYGESVFSHFENTNDREKFQLLNKIKFIYGIGGNDYLVGTTAGLRNFNRKTKEFTGLKNILSNDHLSSICKDKNGNLWIGTYRSGAFLFEKKKNKFSNFRFDNSDHQSIGCDTILTIYNDVSNVTWFGTRGSGISKTDCQAKKFHQVKELKDKSSNVHSKIFMCFTEDEDGNLWTGSLGGGLFKTDKRTGEVKNFLSNSLDETAIAGPSALTLFYNSHLWIGATSNKLNKYEKLKGNFSKFKFGEEELNFIFSIVSDVKEPGRYLWLGTQLSGLVRFDIEEKKFQFIASSLPGKFSLGSDCVKCLYFDKSGNLWAGTMTNGVSRINFENEEIKIYNFRLNENSSLSDNYVTVIFEDSKKNIWIGTHSGGLNKFDKQTETFRKYTDKDGLPNKSIKRIEEDSGGNLWISTNYGLSKFDPEREVFRNYFIEDGLQSNEFNEGASYVSRDGTFYFGGINGYNYFRPDEIEDNPYIPEVVITDFQIFNRSIKNSADNAFLKRSIIRTNEISMTYRESVFSFEFAAMSFNNSSKNQYAYMMEGFDKDWVYSGTRRFATYTNLEPGSYTFRVRGTNNDNLWNETGKSIKINISPPFWKTLWFKTLVAASLVGATGLGYKKKLAKVEKAKRDQEDFSRRLIDSQEAERKKIAAELHHSVAHDILVTKNKAVLGIRKSKNAEEMKNVLNEISDLASNTLNDVRSISYSLHPHQIEQLGMRKAIQSILNNVTSSTDIEFTFTADDIDKVLPEELELNLFRIIQECMNNIMKHSEAKNASLTIKKDNKNLLISIYDDGKGISEQRAEGIGLTEIKERIKLYKGEFVIGNAQPSGTLITITLPITNFRKNEDR